MLQPDAFCENAMQQNATAAGARWGSIQRFPIPLAGFKGPLRGGRKWGREGGEEKGKGAEVLGGRERGGEVDSDAQLEQGRRLAKVGHGQSG